ncbi:MAG TPA: hypothetical protein VNA25_30430 [Phycisphaerae bacterium]|nr:hypothetical protein [Phycisphaerae bacterium]
MNDGAVVAVLGGLLASTSGALVWLVKVVVREYHQRLDRHDTLMDSTIVKNNEALLEVAAKQAESSQILERVTQAVNHNSAIAQCCEEVVSRQMRQRIKAQQTTGGTL